MVITKKSSNLTAYLIGLISGGIGTLAYSPFDYWVVAFLSAIGLIWVATLAEKRTALIATFLWAVSYFAIGVNWVHVSMLQFGGVPEIVSYLAVLLLACYLAIYPLLFSYLLQRFQWHSPWIIASVFTFAEYFRGIVFTGFPWLQFGYTQIDSPFWGIAPLFGVEGLTFFVMLISGYIVWIFRKFAKDHQYPTACTAKLVMILLIAFTTKFFSFIEIDKQKEPTTISLVQGNIEQKMKWDPAHFDFTVQTYSRLIQPLLGKSDIIVLPESAIPALEHQIEPLLTQLDQVAQMKQSEIIIGTLYQSQQGLFNSAVVLGNPKEPYSLYKSARYNKHHLVPFGEYVPFGQLLDWMREVFILPINLSQGDFVQAPLLVAQQRFNMAICYEIIFGHQVQQNQKMHNADYLLTISNDAWFGESQGPWQHFQMTRMRALELGKPLIRATNTGITAFVDHLGKVIAQLPQFEATTLTMKISATKGETLFARLGHWSIFIISGLCLLFGFFKRRKISV
ncbi:apolipoprotein N-acyltransferase [Ursidibacter maritimus]|uniref:Apolipoprotein N-acyltransferase n=1 Tax=Ursidibacter maritimus TaxID=1331689 RepID=A0A949T186_9PAST|nr:apolipoprotein N-acyltransferase [Ursidibacter maritimus]KAE9538275.1 apolipoprotein N-acyltransferase [Ursidibacter maritimus]MBV6524546.1 apolipoprotein N-acyltransferase [Ursidibacter maritimus]MBV6525582.1 apolipoprotein N-acyltransferase [Ursidibacter maritimus]MBV6527668.1 apolipoprotein N-acyltransferase [Ursidibacter maritimus]MBV6529571.1 apolipoprotein N-acyltransferase [Ursidibacter maritimus]